VYRVLPYNPPESGFKQYWCYQCLYRMFSCGRYVPGVTGVHVKHKQNTHSAISLVNYLQMCVCVCVCDIAVHEALSGMNL